MAETGQELALWLVALLERVTVLERGLERIVEAADTFPHPFGDHVKSIAQGAIDGEED